MANSAAPLEKATKTEAELFNEWWSKESPEHDPMAAGVKYAAWNGWLARSKLFTLTNGNITADVSEVKSSRINAGGFVDPMKR